MKMSALDASAVGIFACTLVVTGLAVARIVAPSRSEQPPERRISPSPALTLVGHAIGPASASVTLVEFGDFQCPYCAKAQAVLDSVRHKYPTQVRLLYRHLPLETLHPLAWDAALAAECASDQGKFPEMHDLLFEKQDSLGQLSWLALAKRVLVRDTAAFQQCMAEQAAASRLKRDVLVARDFAVRGTPAFVAGNTLFEGVPSLRWFEIQIDSLLSARIE